MIIIKPYVKGTKLRGTSVNGFKSVSFIDVYGITTVGENDVRYIYHTKNGVEIKVGDDGKGKAYHFLDPDGLELEIYGDTGKEVPQY